MRVIFKRGGWYAKRYVRNVAVGFDQFASAICFGDEDETISSRLGKNQRGDNGRVFQITTAPLRWAVDLFFWPFDGWGHCIGSIEEDEGRNAVFAKVPPQ